MVVSQTRLSTIFSITIPRHLPLLSPTRGNSDHIVSSLDKQPNATLARLTKAPVVRNGTYKGSDTKSSLYALRNWCSKPTKKGNLQQKSSNEYHGKHFSYGQHPVETYSFRGRRISSAVQGDLRHRRKAMRWPSVAYLQPRTSRIVRCSLV